MKKAGFIFLVLLFVLVSKSQPTNCILKPSQFTIHFGTGNVRDANSGALLYYRRVPGSCPTDGHYSFASSTSGCFHDDWHTLLEDHTPGDVNGNMLLVNAGYDGGEFLRTPVTGLKSNTIYELGLWLINLCKPTKKCPTLILPDLTIRLETPEGKTVASIVTGDVPRVEEPRWTQHRAYFTTPGSTPTLTLVMIDNVPGGCGNDFALDDITFRECVKQTNQLTAAPPIKPMTRKLNTSKPLPKKVTTSLPRKVQAAEVIKPDADTISKTISVARQNQKITPPSPSVLKSRENPLVKRIETEAGEIKIDVYDNGQIDGDSVSIYHNNTLVKSHMRLSEKPISFTVAVNPSQPHHEIIMVADNLGSIPPNTSVMIV
ncbi:MAG TPA: hypothetical protein VFP87_08580, partial [Chitinophagaceae bacterium]|nr:hypothetical protein [Chitinophagaceae bacterium]